MNAHLKLTMLALLATAATSAQACGNPDFGFWGNTLLLVLFFAVPTLLAYLLALIVVAVVNFFAGSPEDS